MAEGEPDIWGRWQDDSGLLALQAGVVVRDKFPDRFLDVHEALFALRHDHGGQPPRRGARCGAVLEAQGVDADAVLAEIDSGAPDRRRAGGARGRRQRTTSVWGVPTFIVGDQAAFVRFMDRPQGDADAPSPPIERILDLLDGLARAQRVQAHLDPALIRRTS